MRGEQSKLFCSMTLHTRSAGKQYFHEQIIFMHCCAAKPCWFMENGMVCIQDRQIYQLVCLVNGNMMTTL